MSDLQLKMSEDLPLWDIVFQTLREAILRGDMKPGERLMEMTLADKLGVSRTPVREAIRMLELEGLAITVPRKGAKVAKMTERDMEDLIEIRRVLDELAVKNVSRTITKEQAAELRLAERGFERAAMEGDSIEIAKKDSQFHDVIYRASGNKRLLSLISTMQEQLYRYRMEYLKNPDTHQRLIKEHKEMLEALESGDEEGAIRAARIHIDRQEETVKRMIRRQTS
ncbi:MAG: GntR family transcriptional regulator [Lachnospiraceae bacterium]